MSAQPSSPPEGAKLALVTTVVEANSDGRQALTDNLVAHVRSILQPFTGWYDELAVRRMSKQVGAVVSSSQRVMASQEDAYLAHVSSTLAGRRFQPVGPVKTTDLRQGVAPEDVYERLARQYRYERSTGTDESKALDHVLTRADVMNQMDVALAARSEAEKFFTEHKVTGYRRVIHPELSAGGVCGMCIAATDRVYHRNALMPIHDRCKCGVMPILGGFDAGSALNDRDLSLGDLYENAAGGSKRTGTNMADLKRTRYAVDDHGELGPVLVPKDSGRKRKQPTTLGSMRHPDAP